MIYLNNAATSYPKPQCVIDAYTEALNALPSGQFRSGGFLSAGDIFDTCRQNLGQLLGISETERIFFSSGATDSLNIILNGLGISADEIITTATEHNSVLRPLYNLPAIKGSPVIVPCDIYGTVAPEDMEKAIRPETECVIVNHCSNVTGAVQDIAAIGKIAAAHRLLLILDASQSAGALPVDADGWGVSALAFTGHKSLFGVQGTGGYYVRPGIPFRPSRFGGTGRDSSRLIYDDGDFEYEPGTQNAAGIAALNAGVSYLLDIGVKAVHERETELMDKLYDGLMEFDRARIYGTPEHNAGPVLSFNINGMKPSDTAYILQNAYGIVTRTGLHCAPLIHQYIGSEPDGTVRVSVSYMNTDNDIEELVKAVKDICG